MLLGRDVMEKWKVMFPCGLRKSASMGQVPLCMEWEVVEVLRCQLALIRDRSVEITRLCPT